MVIYQFSNSSQNFFIILFSILLLISTVASIALAPLLKLVFHKSNPIKARMILLVITIVLYMFCLILLCSSIKNVVQYHSLIIDTDINSCSVITGDIENIEKTPQYARGANLTSYHLKVKIDDLEYYIEKDIGVTLENIYLWNEGDNVTIYFKNIDGKNIIVRAIKN